MWWCDISAHDEVWSYGWARWQSEEAAPHKVTALQTPLASTQRDVAAVTSKDGTTFLEANRHNSINNTAVNKSITVLIDKVLNKSYATWDTEQKGNWGFKSRCYGNNTSSLNCCIVNLNCCTQRKLSSCCRSLVWTGLKMCPCDWRVVVLCLLKLKNRQL